MDSPAGYHDDFYAWTQEQASLLEARQFDNLDLLNLVEEVTALGISQKHAVGSHLRNLLLHLLKWQYQPTMRQTGHSWRYSIINARTELEVLFSDSPSLQRQLPDSLPTEYTRARRLAHGETGLPVTAFPEQCPWTVEQLLNTDFFPEA
jgi:hypothetical protein